MIFIYGPDYLRQGKPLNVQYQEKEKRYPPFCQAAGSCLLPGLNFMDLPKNDVLSTKSRSSSSFRDTPEYIRSSLSATSNVVYIQQLILFIFAVLPAFNASISEIISVSPPSPSANFMLIFQSSRRLPHSYALHPWPFSQSHTFGLLSKSQRLTCSGMQ